MSFVSLTPNLALDRTLELGQILTPQTLHRVGSVREVAGGKGVNVARVLKTLGAEATVAGFLGGFNGRKFRHLLEREGLKGTFEEVGGETRECHILLDGRAHPTEVYEKGPVVSIGEWRNLLRRLPEGRLIISGSLPAGITPADFREVLKEFANKPVVDSSGKGLRAALEAGVSLVKPNRSELASLLQVESNGLSEAQTLYESYGVPILLTLGDEGAAYVGEKTLVCPAPKVRVLNPVASGDSLLAAFLWARAEGWSLERAMQLGVAAGAENAARGGGAKISKKSIFARAKALKCFAC